MTTATVIPGLEDVPVAVTTISTLDLEHEQIVVRGYDLIELAKHLCYLEVAFLVIHGRLPGPGALEVFAKQFKEQSEVPDAIYRVLMLMPKTTAMTDALRTGVSFLGGFLDPALLRDTSPEANLHKGISLLAKMPAIAANAYRALNGLEFTKPDPGLGFVENFLYMISGDRPDELAARAVDAIMTCSIEHELPNSTFAARVIASTLTDIYGAVAGAIASWKGPLHGGASTAVVHLLLDILERGGPAVAEAYVKERLARKERIMGFGHRVYMKKCDPRAILLNNEYVPGLTERRPDGAKLYEIYRIVEQTMFQEKGLHPNGDYPIGFIYYLLGVPVELSTCIGVTARTAGLIAHVIEQQADNRLYRPRALYAGPRGLRLQP